MTLLRQSGGWRERARLAVMLGALALHPAMTADKSLAANLTVNPVRLNLSPEGGAKTLRVRNGGSEGTLLQVQAVAWGDDLATASPASEIIAVPPIFRLNGNAEQTIRLALRQPLDGRHERAYRLLVTEVPDATEVENGLVFVVRLSLPLFVTPKGAAPIPAWTIQAAPDGAELMLSNRGQSHIRLESLILDEHVLPVGGAATYVLAGETKSWPLDRPLSALPESLEVRAETNRGPLVAEVRPHAR